LNKKEITWLSGFAKSWRDREEHGRVPHAVLLTGPPGVGKRAAATWIAARHLAIDTETVLPEFPVRPVEHADLHWVAPPEDKQTIGIEQIRDLVAEFGLTSYKGHGKAAVIEPANAMTHNAANSLLKTLEEPPGAAILILIADRAGRLPATIFSRCQRIDIALPGDADGLAWLDQLQPGTDWRGALRLAGGAPLAAIGALEDLDIHTGMSRDFAGIAKGRVSPVEVASRWMKLDTSFVLDWMAREVQGAILIASSAAQTPATPAIDESVLKRMDRRNLFCYLDIINRLRGQPKGSFNVQLTLERLLIEWAEGLAQRKPV
jgi:DNA polymerase III subunit delta'